MGQYRQAAVCRRGHVETPDITRKPIVARCPKCGAAVITQCPSCSRFVRGLYVTDRGSSSGSLSYTPPNFCDGCGAPFPWVDRQGRIYELENLLDQEGLDPADELAAREQLRALAEPDLDDAEQERRWKGVKRLAPGLFDKDSARRIIETVASAAIRHQLGI